MQEFENKDLILFSITQFNATEVPTANFSGYP